MYKHKRYSKGFTLVELLIVIVIIGILTGVVLLTFAGVQQKARNTKTVSNVRQYYTAIQLYRASRGLYPQVPNEGQSPVTMVCLGKGYLNQKCGRVTGTDIYESDAFLQELKTVAGGSLTNSVVNDWPGSVSNEDFIGAVYGIDAVGPPAPHTGRGRVIEWFLEGPDQDCVLLNAYSYNVDTNTACELFIEIYD